jgi:hypothetical protein
MHLLLELVTVVFTALAGLHAWARRGWAGIWLFGSLVLLGWVRESFVVVRDLLYGFAPLYLVLGGTPLIAAVVWAYSIYAALCWSEEVTGRPWLDGTTRDAVPAPSTLGLVALFMMALACFYEPFLALTGMARWEGGTRATAGVPWIALIGYPTLAVAFLAVHGVLLGRLRHAGARLLALGLAMPALGMAHAWALQGLKRVLGW